jgi:hypothetical protein
MLKQIPGVTLCTVISRSGAQTQNKADNKAMVKGRLGRKEEQENALGEC